MNSDDNRCWLYSGCPCRTGGCYGLPDDGCPVYRWFRKLIEEREKKTDRQKGDYENKMSEFKFHDMFPQDPNKETVTEEMHPEKKWFAEAAKMTMDELPDFMDRIIHGYNHDYGTAVHAVSACALAAAWAACREEDTGLTGFQAGFVMWDFIKNWLKEDNKCGLGLIDYDDMLYPQYEERMDKTISKRNWEALQEEAKKNLETKLDAHPLVIAHWQSIVDGNVPFGYKVIDD